VSLGLVSLLTSNDFQNAQIMGGFAKQVGPGVTFSTFSGICSVRVLVVTSASVIVVSHHFSAVPVGKWQDTSSNLIRSRLHTSKSFPDYHSSCHFMLYSLDNKKVVK
jgi:hypothetical protein